jgi:uncharacterized protein (UPF0276 family)
MELGAGLVYFSGFEPALEECAGLIDVLEIEPQTFWLAGDAPGRPPRVDPAHLKHIAELPYPKLVHGVGFPVGGTRPPDPKQLPALRQTLDALRPAWFSEHLSFDLIPHNGRDVYTAFLLPPRQTLEGVRAATESIRALQSQLDLPVVIETGVNYLRPWPDELPDGEFFARVVENTGAGILLDLHNVWANERNRRQSVEDFLATLPLERVCELHLAGGQERRGLWLDAHSGPIPERLFELAMAVSARLPSLGAVIFEMFPGYLHGADRSLVRQQMERVRKVWDARGRDTRVAPKRRLVDADEPREARVSPQEWESALGSLAIGVRTDSPAAETLADDPGVDAIRYVIGEFRGSVLIRTLRLTCRLLMLKLGDGGFFEILRAFWSRHTPELFGSDEARNFAAFLREQRVEIEALEEVLSFELATVETLVDGQPRVVRFPFDPLPVLRSLAEGRLPSMWKSREVEVEITPDHGFVEERDAAVALQTVH